MYYSGLDAVFKPIRFNVPNNETVKSVSCGKDCIFVVTDKNMIWSNSDAGF